MTVKITWTPAHGGGTLKADSAREIVREMWRAAFLHEPTPRAYMKAVAKRAEIMTGYHVRTTSSDTFLRDLETAQIITIDEES
jgi:hypothetical protein